MRLTTPQNEKELHAFKEGTKRKIAMKRGGLDIYNDQSSEDFICDTPSGSSGGECLSLFSIFSG